MLIFCFEGCLSKWKYNVLINILFFDPSKKASKKSILTAKCARKAQSTQC